MCTVISLKVCTQVGRPLSVTDGRLKQAMAPPPSSA